MTTLYLLIESVLVSTLLYLYLHKKTRISLRYLYKDNIVIVIFSFATTFLIANFLSEGLWFIPFVVNPVVVIGSAYGLTMIRFWRTPKRKITAKSNEIVSPADGNVIYITKVEAGDIPVSIKGNTYSKLEELTKTELLEKPCWLVGINMTPFDVHKNCSPIDGKIVFNKHTPGKFLSLKLSEALTDNERNTFVIENKDYKVGVVQIASKLVRRIDTYKRTGTEVKKGDWIGMIRFGSQVDVILPIICNVNVELGEQTYAGKTILAKF